MPSLRRAYPINTTLNPPPFFFFFFRTFSAWLNSTSSALHIDVPLGRIDQSQTPYLARGRRLISWGFGLAFTVCGLERQNFARLEERRAMGISRALHVLCVSAGPLSQHDAGCPVVPLCDGIDTRSNPPAQADISLYLSRLPRWY